MTKARGRGEEAEFVLQKTFLKNKLSENTVSENTGSENMVSKITI